MILKSIVLDGMLSGTGVRDAERGGYIELNNLDITDELKTIILSWLARYESAHYYQFKDVSNNELLDKDGLRIAARLRRELTTTDVSYFSNANMSMLDIV